MIEPLAVYVVVWATGLGSMRATDHILHRQQTRNTPHSEQKEAATCH